MTTGTDIRTRIIKVFEQQIKMSKKAFAEQAGIDSANMSKMFAGNLAITRKTIKKIAETYNINEEWLLTGEGEMLKEAGDRSDLQGESSYKAKKSYTHGVPYYNVDFIGGFDAVMNDQTINPEYLIDFRDYRDATCWCNVTGHSMEPEINHGDIIALRRIEDFSFLPFGEIYAIVTNNELRTIKRIGPGTTAETYTLIPTNTNPAYGIQELPKKMIRAVFQVMGCMKKL